MKCFENKKFLQWRKKHGQSNNWAIYFFGYFWLVCYERCSGKVIYPKYYSGDKIRKTQNEHRIVVCQNLIGSVAIFLKPISYFFGIFSARFLIKKLLELVKSSSDGEYLRIFFFNFGGKFEFRSYLFNYNSIKTQMNLVLLLFLCRCAFLSQNRLNFYNQLKCQSISIKSVFIVLGIHNFLLRFELNY